MIEYCLSSVHSGSSQSWLLIFYGVFFGIFYKVQCIGGHSLSFHSIQYFSCSLNFFTSKRSFHFCRCLQFFFVGQACWCKHSSEVFDYKFHPFSALFKHQVIFALYLKCLWIIVLHLSRNFIESVWAISCAFQLPQLVAEHIFSLFSNALFWFSSWWIWVFRIYSSLASSS